MIEQDIMDIKGLTNYTKYGLSNSFAQKLARGIILNLQEHLNELLQ